MRYETYQIARLIHERTLGVVKEINAHYAVIEFSEGGHRWTIIVDSDEYEIVDEITFGYEEI